MPGEEDDLNVDGSSKRVRLAIEGMVHQRFAERFIPHRTGWVVISNATGVSLTPTNAMLKIAENIVDTMLGILDSSLELMKCSPFNLVILDTVTESSSTEELGPEAMIGNCEVRVFLYLRKVLQDFYGEMWWTQGVPERVRSECAQRREEEGTFELYPPETYLNLIQLREIAQKNWDLVKSKFELVAGAQGKEKGTGWIRDLNEIRKIWAHPLKRLHVQIDSEQRRRVAQLYEKVMSAFGS
jgi:hypothetical protein